MAVNPFPDSSLTGKGLILCLKAKFSDSLRGHHLPTEHPEDRMRRLMFLTYMFLTTTIKWIIQIRRNCFCQKCDYWFFCFSNCKILVSASLKNITAPESQQGIFHWKCQKFFVEKIDRIFQIISLLLYYSNHSWRMPP